ncbi:MAG TPA: tetratricopeptide repeat protein [Methylomirabilota bacterium]|nr:tetratricopeptide repeat protein [Methylomirabilota bacterium]
MTVSVRLLTLFTMVALAAGCAGQPDGGHGPHASAPAASRAASAPPTLATNLGSYSHTITTTSPQAQAFFDQGLRLTYGFNHLEAQRAFREAARLDPNCAMCYWGIALTYGSNYNSPTDPDREKGALAAAQKAFALASRATPAERAMIDALLRRHQPGKERAVLDKAYADAMRTVARDFPQDLEAATFFADAMMNLRPWSLWTPDGQPQPGTAEIVATLERVLAANPNHPGALHLYIHAVEASQEPGKAAAAADRLRGLLPGAGHLVHMPSHIYYRVGRYADATAVNVDAAAADRAYFARSEASPIYRMMYYPHNLDFIWLAASMEGRSAETVRAARDFAAAVPLEMVNEMSDMETAPAAPIVALARFGRWDDVLALPAPSEKLPYVRGVWHYARGLAQSAKGQREAAQTELAALTRLRDGVSAERTVAGFFKTREMLTLAAEVLAGELAARRGEMDAAIRHLAEAVRIQDGHWFTEPPPWYFPVRQALGAVLLQAGRHAEAEAAYREDLRRNPENGWSLYGLAQALRAQGRADEAAAVDARFQRAWARADVKLTASRF